MIGLLLFLLAGTVLAETPTAKAPPADGVPIPMEILNFDQDRPGVLPKELTFSVIGQGPGVRWEILQDSQAPSKPNVLVQSGKADPGQNGAMALIDHVSRQEGEMAVHFKVVGGDRDQGAGLIWRYQDAQTYYAVLANSREDSCAVYRVKKGKYKRIDTKAAIVSPYTWHELQLIFVGPHYTVLLDGEVVMGGKDKGILSAGGLGLWTIGDSQIRFDNLAVSK